MAFSTPILLLIYNRPAQTRQVFAEIVRQQPRHLLVVADGPRTQADDEKCRAARAVVERIDWQCEVLRNFSDVNIGCGKRVSSGITWAFEHCEELIILEDDCVPHPSFFPYCEELLERYFHDPRVMLIGGNTFHTAPICDESYYFSCFAHIWGWATWRRAWRTYDFELRRWPEVRKSDFLRTILEDDTAVENWRNIFDCCRHGLVDTWDYQLVFSTWMQNALAVVPQRNLVSNIGFGEGATHTKWDLSGLSRLKCHEMKFPLRHPSEVRRNRLADQRLMTGDV